MLHPLWAAAEPLLKNNGCEETAVRSARKSNNDLLDLPSWFSHVYLSVELELLIGLWSHMGSLNKKVVLLNFAKKDICLHPAVLMADVLPGVRSLKWTPTCVFFQNLLIHKEYCSWTVRQTTKAQLSIHLLRDPAILSAKYFAFIHVYVWWLNNPPNVRQI